MPQYEIKFLSATNLVERQFSENYDGDDDAIAEAHRAAAGRSVEVWYNGLCIYRSSNSVHRATYT